MNGTKTKFRPRVPRCAKRLEEKAMLANGIRETTATTGTGTLTLAAVTGFTRFANGFANGMSASYAIRDGNNWEWGIGTVGAANTLARTTITATLVAGTYTTAGAVAITLSGTAEVISANHTGSAAILAANTFTAAQEWATGANIASASTVNLDTATGNRVHITGTTTITAWTLTRGPRTVIFDGACQLTYHATTNRLNSGGTDYTTSAGDTATIFSNGTTVYVDITKGAGTAVVAPVVAVYDVASISTGYFDIPSGTTAQRPVAPVGGEVRFNTTRAVPEIFMADEWYAITTADPTPPTQKAIFGYGSVADVVSMTNLVSNTGVVSADVTGVGTARANLAAAGYGGDKAIFGYGYTTTSVSMTNLVSNTGVVAANVTGVGTARYILAAAGYGGDKAIFGYGYDAVAASVVSMTNLVSNTGVVSADVTGVGTARNSLAAAGYGNDKAIFGYGYTTFIVSMTNLVSNTGVVAANVTGVGTARYLLAAVGYGGDKAIFGYGYTTINVSITNLVSNTGVVSADVTGVGTARYGPAPAGYGGDKAIFGYGYVAGVVSMTNLVSNTGVVSADVTGVGTARSDLAAAGYSNT